MMKKSLALSEDGKEDFPTATYSPQHNHLFQTLVYIPGTLTQTSMGVITMITGY